MTTTYGLAVRYGNSNYGVSGHTSYEEAADKMAEILVGVGYTFPKPYEFWRWNEHRPSKELREALQRKGIK